MVAESQSDGSRLRLIVGLGNPGSKYDKTRHNVGFDCLEVLKRRLGNPMPTAKHEGELIRGRLAGRDILLLWPLTYMNASGRSVQQVVKFFKIEPSEVLVICDDLALPLGKLRIRKAGSSGGQKGLEDILRCLNTTEVPRLRIGIDPCPERWETADYVLSRFREEERQILAVALERAADAVADWVGRGIDFCMNEYNRGDA